MTLTRKEFDEAWSKAYHNGRSHMRSQGIDVFPDKETLAKELGVEEEKSVTITESQFDEAFANRYKNTTCILNGPCNGGECLICIRDSMKKDLGF